MEKTEDCLKWRPPPMEDELKISKVEYLWNRWLNLPQILKLSLRDLNKFKNSLKRRRPPMEDNLKYQKLNILEGTVLIFLNGNLECGSAQPSLLLVTIQIKLAQLFPWFLIFISQSQKLPTFPSILPRIFDSRILKKSGLWLIICSTFLGF
jgi:hypothetical protein